MNDIFDSAIFHKVPTKDYSHIKFKAPKDLDGPAVLDNSQDAEVTINYRVKTMTVIDIATGKKIGGQVEILSDWPIPEDECRKICDEVIAGMWSDYGYIMVLCEAIVVKLGEESPLTKFSFYEAFSFLEDDFEERHMNLCWNDEHVSRFEKIVSGLAA